MKVILTNPGLYGVFTGEMIGQFSDGYWENSVKFRKDYHLYKLSETFFDENSSIIPTIRYNINTFFTHCAESGYLTCIITRVLMVYNHGELIKKVYNTEGKEKADDLISILADPVYFSELGIIDINALQGYYRGCCERSLKTIDEYFGNIENFKNAIPAITPENIKKFRKIGKELNDSFTHVKNFYDLH